MTVSPNPNPAYAPEGYSKHSKPSSKTAGDPLEHRDAAGNQGFEDDDSGLSDFESGSEDSEDAAAIQEMQKNENKMLADQVRAMMRHWYGYGGGGGMGMGEGGGGEGGEESWYLLLFLGWMGGNGDHPQGAEETKNGRYVAPPETMTMARYINDVMSGTKGSLERPEIRYVFNTFGGRPGDAAPKKEHPMWRDLVWPAVLQNATADLFEQPVHV